MSNVTQMFLAMLIGGLFLIGMEIFLPGGVLGVLGGLALVVAIILAFATAGPTAGFLVTLLVVILLGVFIYVWLKFFPDTPIGRALTLSSNQKTYKATDEDIPDLMDKEGVTQSTLKPSGIAKIEGERVDVLAESGWIDKGKKVRVVKIEGNRVVVRKITEEQPQNDQPGESA